MKIYSKRDTEIIFPNSYGYFTSGGWEYVIEDPLTPRPWVNVISNGKYGLLITQRGGGFSWMEDAVISRITRWYPEVLEDRWGKFLYLLDRKKKKFFSLTYEPIREGFTFYQVRHAPGYSIISGSKEGFSWSIYYFVPLEDNLEVWYLLLENRSSSPRDISLFTFFEWCLGNGVDTHWEYQRTFIETDWDGKERLLLARKRTLTEPHLEIPLSCFLTSSPPPSSYEGDKECFLGRGTLEEPESLLKGVLSRRVGKWGYPAGIIEVRMEIRPGERKEILFFLGMEEERDKISSYRNQQRVAFEWKRLRDFWREFLSRSWVETPDSAFNIMNNIWLKYQTIAGRIWGRTGFYQSSGAFGFRDQLQDSLLFLTLEPEFTRRQIVLHAKHQFRKGFTYHWWHESISRGPVKKIGDDYLWIPFVLCEYLKETEDWAWVTGERIPFVDGGEGTLLEHALLSIERALKFRGKRGLPLIGEGDWNDGMNRMEGGESVWLGEFLIYILKNFSYVMDRLGMNSRRYRREAERLSHLIKSRHWDGGWFRRAYLEDGTPVGSQECEEGMIFLNPQSWAIISGILQGNETGSLLEAVRRYLYTPSGPRLLFPPYTRVNPRIGYLTRYAPGVRENGGVYTHAAAWWVMALCILGKREEAFRIYSSLLPIHRAENPEIYLVEPYVTSGNTDVSPSPHPGRGGWTWYTGSSQWLYRVGMEWIVGVRPQEGKLIFKPCWPPEWKEVHLIRVYRGRRREFILNSRTPSTLVKD